MSLGAWFESLGVHGEGACKRRKIWRFGDFKVFTAENPVDQHGLWLAPVQWLLKYIWLFSWTPLCYPLTSLYSPLIVSAFLRPPRGDSWSFRPPSPPSSSSRSRSSGWDHHPRNMFHLKGNATSLSYQWVLLMMPSSSFSSFCNHRQPLKLSHFKFSRINELQGDTDSDEFARE